MRHRDFLLFGLMAFALSGCLFEEECTDEVAQRKLNELTEKVQAVAASDPTRLPSVITKAAELQSTLAEAGDDRQATCDAIDELMDTLG